MYLISAFLVMLSACISPLVGSVSLNPDDPKWRWMDQQIDEQLSVFSNGITEDMLNLTMERKNQIFFGNELLRFQVINNKIYGPPQMTPARYLLEKVVSLYELPDIDLILFTQDIIWNDWLIAGPVFVTCKRIGDSQKTLHLPIQVTMQWETDYEPILPSLFENSPWETKEPKIFWRGYCSDAHYTNFSVWTTQPRGKLCCLSKQFPDLIDAAFSGYHGHLVPPEVRPAFLKFFQLKRATWEEYVHHKYLMDLDGYVAASPGCAWKLLSNCAVFKHDTRFILWFYRMLKPWVHYIPVKNDLSDIFEKLEWAKKNDSKVKTIAENGRKFALENIMSDHIYLYCYKAFKKYASLQKFQPRQQT